MLNDNINAVTLRNKCSIYKFVKKSLSRDEVGAAVRVVVRGSDRTTFPILSGSRTSGATV